MPPKGQRDAERSVTLTQNRKEVDPSTRQCNVCEAFGHTWLECPKGNKNMQKKEIARRAERQAPVSDFYILLCDIGLYLSLQDVRV